MILCIKMATTLLRTSASVLRRTVAFNTVRAASGPGPVVDHQKGKIGNFIQGLYKTVCTNDFSCSLLSAMRDSRGSINGRNEIVTVNFWHKCWFLLSTFYSYDIWVGNVFSAEHNVKNAEIYDFIMLLFCFKYSTWQLTCWVKGRVKVTKHYHH